MEWALARIGNSFTLIILSWAPPGSKYANEGTLSLKSFLEDAMGTALHTTDANFKKDVLDSNVPVLVDFWAEWCGPCRMVAPVLDELAKEYDGKIKVAKVNVDENQQVSMDFHIRSIPTLLFFKNGQMVKQLIGAHPKSKLVSEIQEVIGN